MEEYMKIKTHALCHFNFKQFAILLCLLAAITPANKGFAANSHYAGNGVSFDYPDKYSLSTSSKKSGETVLLKNGSDSISIQVMKNELIDNFDGIVIGQITKQFKDEGYKISGVENENKKIPLKVKGDFDPVPVDAVKYNHVVEVTKKDITINLKQTMFFYSYAEHGYMINYTRVKGKYSDLVTVLSTFTFDEKEQAEDSSKTSAY